MIGTDDEEMCVCVCAIGYGHELHTLVEKHIILTKHPGGIDRLQSPSREL